MQQDDWLNFWFKPQLFIHQSWLGEIDERLLNKSSSSLAWHLSYDYVCDCYRLPKEYQEPEEGLALMILQDLLQNDETIVDLATMMVSSLAVDKSMSVDIRRKILQRNRALSLQKRFLEACRNLTAKEFGTYFIYLAVMLATPKLWRRIRLLFPRDTVENIERAGKQVPRIEANEKAIRRAWAEIFNLKHELKPAFAMTDAEETIANIDAEAANDASGEEKCGLTDEELLAAAG